jgi:hypothetical protein
MLRDYFRTYGYIILLNLKYLSWIIVIEQYKYMNISLFVENSQETNLNCF